MYLVQRCMKRFKQYASETVSEAFALDYMGSAEFEFGAIPKSIRKLAQKTLVQTSFKHKNSRGREHTIYVVADHNEQGEAVEAVREYLNGKTPSTASDSINDKYRGLREFLDQHEGLEEQVIGKVVKRG